MPVKRTLIRGGSVYDHDGDVHHPPLADVLIEGDTIIAVGGERASAPADEVIDATGRLILPGLINAHYHSHDVLCRGLFEELPLEIWLLYTLPMGANRSNAELRARTLVGALECLRCGITTVQDMLGLVPLTDEQTDVVIAAYREAGIRVVFSPMVWDIPPVAMLRGGDVLPETIKEMLGNEGRPIGEQVDYLKRQLKRHSGCGTLHWAVAPFAPQRCTLEMLSACAELAGQFDLPVYTHVCETRGQALLAREKFAAYGGSFLGYLDAAGLLSPRLNLVHGVWLTRAELARLAAAGAGIVLNPVSNLKLKSGIAPICEMSGAGLRLALGCDNCSGTDVENMFQAMKMACLLAAVGDPEPGSPWAQSVLRHATLGAARSAGLSGRLGAIQPGYKADLVLIDLTDAAYLPLNSAARQLVYTESGRGVESVMVDGRMVVRNRRVMTVDEDALRREVHALMRHFLADYDFVVKSRAAALPHLLAAHRRAWQAELDMDRFVPRLR